MAFLTSLVVCKHAVYWRRFSLIICSN